MLSGLADRFDPRHLQRLDAVNAGRTVHRVAVTRLATLLEKHGLLQIDFCSIDTEGAELSILRDLDLTRFRVSVFAIENNYDDPRLAELMLAKGYEFVAKLEQDYVFKRLDVPMLPMTSVLCAVWHQDPERCNLLRGHAANLAAQTVPVEPIHLFDGTDEPPDWLAGRKIAMREDVTIHQAWNVGLSLVSTPLVMNLNLDDRLAPDAVRLRRGADAPGERNRGSILTSAHRVTPGAFRMGPRCARRAMPAGGLSWRDTSRKRSCVCRQ